VVVAINKWDNMDEYDRKQVKMAIDRRLDFIPYVKIHLISALHGTGVGDLYPSIQRAYDSAMLKTPTNKLTQILQDAVEGHQPPLVHGRRIKLRYAHMGGQNPPIIVIHGNQTESVSKDYKRYLENIFRKVLKLQGTPIQLEFKTSDNPYKEDKKVITPVQLEKLKRFVPSSKRRDKNK
jgi:GTP-binding protein